MKDTMGKRFIAAALAGAAMSCFAANAALPTKFRWDDVDGKGTSYTTPVKMQTGSTDRSYAYSMMDYLETMRLIHAGTSYNSLTGPEKVDALGLVELYADNAENRRGAIGDGDGFEVPVMEKSLDWMLRYGYNGHRVVDISFLLESQYSPIGKSINKNEITTLKKWIVEQGPFVVGYKHFDDYVAGAKYCYLPPRNSRLKYEEYNHHRTALIIGYDDSVPASAFSASAIHPDGPGAWIVKGNQGVAYGDNGYYYVSYYDESLLCYNGRLNEFCNYGTGANSGLLRLDELAAKVIDVDWDYKYGNVYCHDASTPCSFWWGTINSGGASGFVNLFTAQSNDVVNAVGFWLDVPYGGTNILVTAYVGCDEGKPFSGRCMFFQKPLWFPSSGYHAIPLPEPLQFDVKAGQRFSVALEYGSNAAYNSVEPYRPAYAMALQLVDNPARGCSFYWDYSPNRLLDLAEESRNGPDPVLLDPLAGLSTLYHPVRPNMCFITAYTAAEGQIVLTATKGTVDDGIEVRWTTPRSGNGCYDLYRSEANDGNFQYLMTVSSTCFFDSEKMNQTTGRSDGAKPGIRYWYYVKTHVGDKEIESNHDYGFYAPTPPDDPTPDDPTPDNPTPGNPTPDNPTPGNPTPDKPDPPPPPCPVCQVVFQVSTNSLPAKTIGTYIVDSCCGEATEQSFELTVGEPFGELPMPLRRAGYRFDGWYTGEDGSGMKVTPDTIVPDGDFVLYQHWIEVGSVVDFESQSVVCEEGSNISIVVIGGSGDSSSSAKVFLTYNTAVASDVDMAKGAVDGVSPKGGLKFPLTLTWEKGEIGEKVITIPIKTDKAVEGDEFFTLQLADAVGQELGETTVCTVAIKDMNTNLTLQEGMLSPTLSATTSGDGSWFVASGSPLDEAGLPPLYHVESPLLSQGKKSTLALSAVKGMGVLYFSIRFSGDPEEETPSRLDVYEGKRIIGSFSHAEVTNDWKSYKITINSMSGSHAYSFVFTQGSDPDAHAEVSDVTWDSFGNITLTSFYRVYAASNDPAGGIVSGSGWYSYGQAFKLVARPFPGWKSDGWYEIYEDEDSGAEEFFLWSTSATVSYKIDRNAKVIAFFSKIPYVCGLANPADGGKVSGSGYCDKGKKVTLKATANKGFAFVGWTTNAARSVIAPYPDGDFVATTASLVIDRTAKPAASTKTSTTITEIDGDVTYYAVFKSDPEIFVTVDATDEKGAEPTGKGAGKYVAGTITGMGKYAPGKTKIALKAAANKGYVFAGWFDADSELLTKNATYTVASMGESDVEYTAKFVTAEEDKDSIALGVNGAALSSAADVSPTSTNIWAGVYIEWPVAASALSEAKVKVAGLPSGLKFTDKPVTSKIGTGKTAVTITNVPANTIYGAPTAASKMDKGGNPTPSAVKFTVTTAGKSTQTYQIDMVVDALPTWAQGTFAGGMTDGGQVSLTVSAAGKTSGKALGDGLTYTLAAPYYTGFEMTDGVSNFLADVTATWSYKEGAKTVKTNDVVKLVVKDNGVGGYAAADDWFEAYTVNWKVEPWKTLGKAFDKRTFAYAILPDGSFSEDEAVLTSALGADVTARVTLKFSASGAVSVVGEFEAGIDARTSKYIIVKASGSATLVPVDDEHYAVFVYLLPKGLPPHARCVEVPLP